jgi:histidine triad (HIT) family protein
MKRPGSQIYARYNGPVADCVFCKIINRQIPAHIVSETEKVIVFVSLHNDLLVVPKKHIKDIYELDVETGSEMMTELIKTAKAVRRGFESEGVYITQANEPAAGQDVFHLHFHVYPRWRDKARNRVARVGEMERRATMEKASRFYE